MGKRFVIFHQEDTQGIRRYYVGIELQVAGSKIQCPLSQGPETEKGLLQEIESLQKELEKLKERLQISIARAEEGVDLDFAPDTPAPQVWDGLCKIEDEEAFVASFNSLPQEQRERVADFVLGHCNVFSGRAAVLSARYNSESGILE